MFSSIVLLIAFASLAHGWSRDETTTSGLLARVKAGKKLVFDLAQGDSDGSSDSSADSHAHYARKHANQPNDEDVKAFLQEQMIAKALAAEMEQEAEDAAAVSVLRQAFQARFERSAERAACAATDSTCLDLAIGPAVLIAKTSTSSVLDDAFDGNLDGLLDVSASFNAWADAAGANADTNVGNFLLQIRNRADVNGGSISLTSLILTGRRADNGAFASFGPDDTLLISPCFPVLMDLDAPPGTFNLQVFAGVAGFADLVTTVAPISIADFTAAPGEFKTATDPFTLTTASGANLTPPVGSVGVNAVAANSIGTVFFEQCTQHGGFGYFQ